MQPAWHNYLDNFQSKFRIGALAYLDYGYYSHTGFGPQWLENMNPPGVGNNGYNAFDINRVYLNTYFTPLKDWTFRFTPEIYRADGTASNDKVGTTTGVAHESRRRPQCPPEVCLSAMERACGTMFRC